VHNAYMGMIHIRIQRDRLIAFMHRFRTITLLCLALPTFAHGAEFRHYDKAIHPSVGILRFVLSGVPVNSGESTCCSGEDIKATILISDSSGKVVQKIPQDFLPVDRGGLDFMDVNGDGYVDLLIYNNRGGAGPLMQADIWIYAPRLGVFVMSKTLSGIGDVKKSTRTNCVLLDNKTGNGYATEEWCFNQMKGLWKLLGTASEQPEDE